MATDREPTPEEAAATIASTLDPALGPTFPALSALSGERPITRRALPPSLVTRYEDLELVGEGGMGIVYRGHDPRLGRTVALKLIKGDDPALWRRFIQEARSQARVQHENVCRVYEAGQADGEPYIVMQFIEGEPLSRMGDRLSLEQGVALMREVASAVHEAHRLGLVHRDLKPQNVLVETQEDGTWKPYVMDFGLAREVAERGETATGSVVGTPAYMPPEQALGDVRAMDRRSDVYSLGATLYDLIAGRPPFVDEHPWKLLMMVAYEEVPPLGHVKKGVPKDLETIVMKCLERPPGRRYDSARAFAEDLGRFLDGDPIQARRASLGYVAWKKARKHKLATALGATALAAALSLGGVWAKGRRDAAEQARLGQALGEDVKGMELFLRNAYGMPLHDVERERDVVRRRLARIEANMAAAGRVGQGPGHYAMGRGHLALGDPAEARAHLEKARAAGYSSAALDSALGQALGELFRRAIDETKRITNEEERRKKVAALEATLRDPALARLRAAVGGEVEAPAFAEGLIALYEGKNEGALEKARAAFAAAPWMYEAKKLEGDAHYALGSPFRHDAAFDWEKMMAHFQPAAEAYRAAADLARSDPEVHRAECELWEKIGWAEEARDDAVREGFERADAACARAVAASHADGRARVQRALVLSARVNLLGGQGVEKAIPLADEAVRAAEEALRLRPGDVMAHYAAARAAGERIELLQALQRDVSMEPVIAAYERAVALDPRFTWAISELGDAYLVAAQIEQTRGGDVRRMLENAGRQFDRAALVDPAFSMPTQKKVKVYASLLEDDLEHGRGEGAGVAALFEAVDALDRRVGSAQWASAFWRAKALRIRSMYELSLGRDPRAFMGAAREALRPFLSASARDPRLLVEAASGALVEAIHASRTGASPRPIVAEARLALRDAAEGVGTVSSQWRVVAARVELVSLRDALKQGDARAESFEAAFSLLRPLAAARAVDPDPHRLMAEIHARRAAWMAEKGRDASVDVAAGRALVDAALARNPRHAEALATRALLELPAARAAQVAGERAEAAGRARQAFTAAFAVNPRLALDYADEVREIAAPPLRGLAPARGGEPARPGAGPRSDVAAR